MDRAPPSFPLRRSPRMAWRPMQDAEWDSLQRILRRSGMGRPSAEARRSWDGVFWVACSTGPWREMPAEFGRADTAHRALRRAAAARLLHRMLLRVCDHPAFAGDALRGIEWFIVRAFRRAFRVAPCAITYARHLGLADALPAAPCWLPNPTLSETVRRIALHLRANPGPRPLPFLKALLCLFRGGIGEPRQWRTTG
jgi:transposase